VSGSSPAAGLVVTLEDVEPITWGGQEAARFLLRGEDTGGRFSFYEVSVPAGESSLRHLHHDADETFLVVEGEFEITIGEQAHRTTPGMLVYGPRAVPHSFRNSGGQTSTMLCIMAPAGIETFFSELSTLVGAHPAPQWEDLRLLAERHRITAFPPREGD